MTDTVTEAATVRLGVVGCGSIGQRHIRNLIALGASVAACDPDAARRQEAAALGASTFDRQRDLLNERLDGVLVCTPPHLHAQVAIDAVAAGAHLFIEKPIGTSLAAVDAVLEAARASRRHVLVGYNLRFHQGLRRVKALVDAGAVGRLLMISCEFGQYLPDWRPTRDYRAGYNASREAGGGIILDGSHEIDYVRWIGGEIASLAAMAGKLSDLEIEVEDAALMTVRFANGALGAIHVDSLQRTYTRTCKIVGTEGTLAWDYTAGIRLAAAGRAPIDEEIRPPADDMYRAEMAHFLACVRGEASPLVTGGDGRRVLELALQARAQGLALAGAGSW